MRVALVAPAFERFGRPLRRVFARNRARITDATGRRPTPRPKCRASSRTRRVQQRARLELPTQRGSRLLTEVPTRKSRKGPKGPRPPWVAKLRRAARLQNPNERRPRPSIWAARFPHLKTGPPLPPRRTVCDALRRHPVILAPNLAAEPISQVPDAIWRIAAGPRKPAPRKKSEYCQRPSREGSCSSENLDDRISLACARRARQHRARESISYGQQSCARDRRSQHNARCSCAGRTAVGGHRHESAPSESEEPLANRHMRDCGDNKHGAHKTPLDLRPERPMADASQRRRRRDLARPGGDRGILISVPRNHDRHNLITPRPNHPSRPSPSHTLTAE